ncbi:MAG: aldehyde dehydrogenase family protein, partial [Caulobacteraceae bacterium]
LKRLSLELGGNAPFVVFDDADLEAAVEGAIASKYRNAGQTCVCTNRFIVQDGIYDAFVKRLAERAGELKIGDGLAAGSVIGPMIDDKAIAKVREHLDDAVAKGARVVAGGQVDAAGALFFQPTVLADATPDMQIFKEETFGPLAPIFRFQTEAEGIALANDTEFGLAAYFYTRDVARAWRVSEALEVGMVGQNTGLISNEVAPFGGIKQSGFGREGSRYGLEEYIDIKYVCVTVPAT